MSIKLITFDLDDTLWDNVPVIISAEASMREWLAVHASKVGDLPLEQFACSVIPNSNTVSVCCVIAC